MIDGARVLVSLMEIFVALCQVAAEHRQVGMSHQLLQTEDVHATPEATQRKRSSERVQAGCRNTSLFGPPSHDVAQPGIA